MQMKTFSFTASDGCELFCYRWTPDPKKKIVRLLSFAGKTRDIADPWYTGNFDQTYEDIVEGCTAFLKFLG